MKNTFRSSLAQLPLLQSFPSLELRTPHHLTDFQPFSLELLSYTSRIRSVALAFLVVGLMAICTTLSFEFWQADARVIAENALLELGQGAFLLVATLVQAARAFTNHDSGLKRDIRMGLALFTFALFLREVDINKLGPGVGWDISEYFLRTIALIAILSFIFHMSRRLKPVLRNLGKILLSPTVLISILACMLYICGWPFDKELFNIDKSLSRWLEETLELNACLIFLCAGLVSNIKTDVVKIQASSF
ncbi:MAG TPA: hypothetical protein VLC79_11705 [Cellvibrio sp.]|nr:hypothetical protein [Cellvibrio sp.]